MTASEFAVSSTGFTRQQKNSSVYAGGWGEKGKTKSGWGNG